MARKRTRQGCESPERCLGTCSVRAGLLFGAATPSRAADSASGFENQQLGVLGFPTGLAFTPDGRLLLTHSDRELLIYENGAMRSDSRDRPRSAALHEHRARACSGSPSIPASRQPLHLPLLHVRQGHRQLRHRSGRPSDRSRSTACRGSCSGRQLDRPGERDGAARQHPLGERQPQRRRPPLRQGRLPLRERRRRRLRLRRTTAVAGQRTTPRATRTCCSARSCASPPTARSRSTTRFGRGHQPAATSPAARSPGTWCQETFASGLRNPFRFAFDPNAAGHALLHQRRRPGHWEEIDLGQPGADYGWNVREGHCADGLGDRLRAAAGRA